VLDALLAELPGEPLPGAAKNWTTTAGDEPTRWVRLHRRKYQPLIDALYSDKKQQFIETVVVEDGAAA
jgi:hypothetical protein